MKRLMTLLLAAGLMLGSTVSNASAVEVEVGGQWQFGWFWSDMSLSDNDNTDTFKAKQRIRPEFRFVADENLQAVLQFEIGSGDWGNGAWGMGADKTDAVKFRYGYVDWVVPSTSYTVRMGMQYAENALYTFAPVLAADVAGIAVSGQLTDNVGMTLAWYRPYNGAVAGGSSDRTQDTAAHVWGNNNDTIDVFYAAFPVKFDGFEMTPWGMYAAMGKNIFESDPAGYPTEFGLLYDLLPEYWNHSGDWHEGRAYWLGLGGKLTMFDPFTLAFDFNWGHASFGTDYGFDTTREGWQFAVQATYATDYVTPSLVAWYATGDDSNGYNGSERIPTLAADAYGTTFGMDGSWTPTVATTASLAGTWGVGLWLDNISFVDKLTHSLRATYYRGTNNKAMAREFAYSPLAGGAEGERGWATAYLTTGDSAWEFTLDSDYQIYKNLTASLMMGYVKYDLCSAWDGQRSEGYLDDSDDDMYRIGLYMTYKF